MARSKNQPKESKEPDDPRTKREIRRMQDENKKLKASLQAGILEYIEEDRDIHKLPGIFDQLVQYPCLLQCL